MEGPSPRQRLARRLEQSVAAVSIAASWVAGLACLGTLLMICYAVGMRYFLNQPQAWTDEAVGWLIVVAVMFAVPEAQRRGEHIGVDLLFDRWKGERRRLLAMFGVLTVAASAAILISEGIDTVAFSRMIGSRPLGIPEVPIWIVQVFIPVGAALLLLVALAQLAIYLVRLEPRGLEPGRIDAHE